MVLPWTSCYFPRVPDPKTLFLGFFFGVVGLVAFRHGKRESNMVCLLLGIALMVYPYFVSSPLATLAIGVGLTAVIWNIWDR